MFVDAAGDDFHLQSVSPCIDTGDDLGSQVSEDFEGDSRPQGTGFDIGADEYTASILPSGEIIIDNTDAGFSSSFAQDAWHEYVEPGGEHYRDTHCYNGQPGSGEDVATWSFSVPLPGQYQVYAWWYAGEERPTDVPFTVAHLVASTVITVNQRTDGGQWNLLGTFDFWRQGSVTVSDQVSSGQNIVADAVRIVYVGPLSNWKPIYLPLVTR